MSEYREFRNEGSKTMIHWGLLILALIIIGTVAFAVLRPLLLEYQTRANQASQGYVETKQRLLVDLIEDYTQLDVQIAEANSDHNSDLVRAYTANRSAVLDQIYTEAETIDRDQLPESVARFLAAHPR